ncbi:MAG: DPP IV N-terminal domain-containing protein, partial [Gemmatimonadetes bacterium]|nr:DPP IV N-terminal domain-containing protein [Gemmatimonadota bacterium]
LSCERPAEETGRRGGGGEPAADSLTVRRIFTPPLPDGNLLQSVTWRTDGGAVAFLTPARIDSVTGDEVLELWLADPATGERRRLIGAAEILGGERQSFGEAEKALRERLRLSALGITSYDWSPDGTRILIPLSGDIYEVDAGGGTPRHLTETDAPEFDPRYSPNGARIAFVRDGDLHVLDVESGRERRLTTEPTTPSPTASPSSSPRRSWDASEGSGGRPTGAESPTRRSTRAVFRSSRSSTTGSRTAG